MSGIAAIVRFDGGPIAPGAIEAVTSAMAYRGPDGITHWHGGSVALGHCMLRTTPESLGESQPLANEDSSLVLVMDGWLSNWEELRTDLLARGARLRDRSDAELVLRAYEVWGDDCPKHIDGEFALVVWDARRREAFLANDHVGLKSLHYHWDGRQLVVASDIVGVLAGPGIERAFNRGRIAELAAFDLIGRSETVWEGVRRSLPAHAVRFAQCGATAKKYWEPPFEVGIRYTGDGEYVEHYRAVFADSVRRSSRSHLPLACDVSGGLDSSAVFAMAHDLRRGGHLPAPAVMGYTYRWDEAVGSDFDEIEYARAVARHVGAEVREIRPFLPELGWFVDRGRADCTLAGYPNGAMAIAIGEALVADGSRVILNGEGGDEWLGGKPFYFAEQIAERDWGMLARTLRDDIATLGLRKTARNFLRYGIGPLLPRPVLDARRAVLARWRPDRFAAAEWLGSEWRALLEKRRAARDRNDFLRIANLARRSMYMVLTDPFALPVWDQASRQSARIGYEIRTPMYARQFIEFAFATPERIRMRSGLLKQTHVAAMEDLLPAIVRERITKADFNVAFLRRLDDICSIVLGAESKKCFDVTSDGDILWLLQASKRIEGNSRVMWLLWTIFEVEHLQQG